MHNDVKIIFNFKITSIDKVEFWPLRMQCSLLSLPTVRFISPVSKLRNSFRVESLHSLFCLLSLNWRRHKKGLTCSDYLSNSWKRLYETELNPFILKSEQMKLFNIGVATGLTISNSSNDDSQREIVHQNFGVDSRAAKFKGLG